MAAWEGYHDVIKLLIFYGANPKNKNKDGITPLHCAICSASRSLISVNLLLDHGADVDAKDNFGISPLYFAVSNEHRKDIVNALFEHNVNPNIQTNDGKTPLHKVSSLGSTYFVDTLLRNGANQHIKDKSGILRLRRFGKTPADYAKKHGYHELAARLQQEMEAQQPPAS